jgi:hypothetical protein
VGRLNMQPHESSRAPGIRRADMVAADWHHAVRECSRLVKKLTASANPSTQAIGLARARVLGDLERAAKSHARERIRAAKGDK